MATTAAAVAPLDVSATLRRSKNKMPSIKVDKEDDLQYDLGNLMVTDVHPLNFAEEGADKDLETFLIEATREDAQLLINHIFELPTTRVDMDVVATLPEPTTEIPREKPVPKARAETKWDRFARQKGIKKVKKRGRLIWDDEVREWRPRFGFKKANDEMRDWIIPAKQSDQVGTDPWEKMMSDKRQRIKDQRKAQAINIKRAKTQQGGGLMNRLMSSAGDSRRKTEKMMIDTHLNKTRKATASVGVFEKLLPKEKSGPRERQKFQPLINEGEKDRSIKVLDRMFAKKPDINIKKAVKEFNRDPNFRKEVLESKFEKKRGKVSRKALPHKKKKHQSD